VSTEKKIDYIAKYYGLPSQLLTCQEECAELIKEIGKFIKYYYDDRLYAHGLNLIEEIADVSLMIMQIEEMKKVNGGN